jgi:tetratricopeptide (TPR) repeat protein
VAVYPRFACIDDDAMAMDLTAELASARSAIDEGRLDQARAACQRILDRHRDHPAVWFLSGLTALEAGATAQAIEALEQTVSIRPVFADGHLKLGRAYQAAGRIEDALTAFRRAHEISPRSAETLLLLGTAEIAAGDRAVGVDRCLAGLRMAVRERLSGAALRSLLALVPLWSMLVHAFRRPRRLACAIALDRALIAERMGDAPRADAWLRAAAATDPADSGPAARLARRENDLGGAASALAICEAARDGGATGPDLDLQQAQALLALGDVAGARAPLMRALTALPDNVEALCLRGSLMSAAGDPAEGRAAYQTALEREPDSVEAVAGIARCMMELGRMDEAAEWLWRAIGLDEARGSAWFALARIGTLSAEGQAFARLLHLLEDGRFDAPIRTRMHFAAGMVFDRAGRADEASEHLAAGNRLVDVSFSADAHDRFVDRLIAAFDADFVAANAAKGVDSDRPVFVVGMPRSGTTLVEQIVASHPQAFGAGELDAMNLIAERLARRLAPDGDYLVGIRGLDAALAQGCAGDYLREIGERAGGAPLRVIDKMPGNFVHLGLIAALFPRARVIHCTRDPMDTCLSIYFQLFEGHHPYAYDLRNLGRYYRAYERLMAHWKAVLPIPIMDMPYEWVVADQRGATEALLAFCGLGWDDACLDFHRTERPIRTASDAQVRQAIYRHAVGRWKVYESHLGPLKAALGDRAPA